jgi:hypothetical protein
MRDYGKVHTSFWASETVRDLDDDCRLLALYLLTCTHSNMAGAFRLPDGYVVEDLGWTSERFRNGIETLSTSGFVSYCNRSKWVLIIKFLSWNKPENPNQWKAVAKFIGAIPENCSFRNQMLERVPEPFRNSPVPSPVPVPEKKAKSEKSKETILADWITSLDGADALPADDPLFGWASSVKLPRDWIALAWWAFEGRYTANTGKAAKKYTDWRAAFRDHVQRDFLKLWAINRDGEYYLTTTGKQAQLEMAA